MFLWNRHCKISDAPEKTDRGLHSLRETSLEPLIMMVWEGSHVLTSLHIFLKEILISTTPSSILLSMGKPIF